MKIFMISYGAAHVNIMSPVYKELIKNKDNSITYAALTVAPLKLKGTGIEYVTVSELARMLPYYDTVKMLGRKYGLLHHNNNFEIPEEDTIAYYGIGMHDLIEEYGITEAEERFALMERKAFLPVRTMKELLKRINPDVCVITDSPRMEKATGIAACELHIPVVRVNNTPTCEPVVHTCALCVMNEWAKSYAVSVENVPEKDIYITGQPAFDSDFLIEKSYVDEIKDRCGGNHFSKVVTFFAENGVDQSKELNALFEIARAMKDVLFVVKLHPNQPLEIYGNPQLENMYFTNEDPKPYFHFSDLVITTFSTTGLESSLFGIPVIVINFDGRKYLLDYIDLGIAVLCDKAEDLREMIQIYLDKDSEAYTALKESQGKFQFVRNAAQNICNVIKEAVKKAS